MNGNSSLHFCSCERHFKLTEEMHIPLKPTPKEDTVRLWPFYKLGNLQKLADLVLDTFKVTQLKLLSQEKR